MTNQPLTKSKFVLTGLTFIIVSAFQTAQAEHQDYIINCNADCVPLIEKVSSLGGTITNKYTNINAISVSMDSDHQAQLLSFSPNAELTKDKIFSLPEPKDYVSIVNRSDLQILQGDALQNFIDNDMPEGFEFNNILTGAATMNAAGFSGQGTIVAVIDTGTANNSSVVATLAGSVIGGENFVPGANEPAATSTLNASHGTQTGTMIAGHGFFLINPLSTFAQSVSAHMPDSIFNIAPTLSVLPLFGSAPDAKIYAMKVFPASGGGAPESRVIAAMDRAITLRTNYNNGIPSVPVNPGCGAEEDPCVYNSMNINVVNMSLGGGTLYAAKDLEDQLTAKMLEVGITLVASAGNEGFTAMTGGSPGTGLGTLTVGAASTVGNERVLRDLQFGFGFGNFYRPSNHHQMATFSSRGPSTDGRISTDVVANGFACLVQTANGGLSLASGTSFSAPMVAGAAATLIGAFPKASAAQIRNAIIQGANPNILGDDSAPIDQGAGFIDVPNSFNLLATGKVNSDLPEGKGHKSVKKNVKSLGIKIISPEDGEIEKSHVSNLKPGQVAHFFIESEDETDQITIKIENIVASLPASDQNIFFGDDIFYQIQDAITHTEATIASGFIVADEEIVIDNPQTGLLRLAIMGDWTNAGTISADITISAVEGEEAEEASKGRIDQSEFQVESFYIPDGTTQATFELSWKNNWGAYPTDDIDFILLDPNSVPYFNGATFSSPERVVINNPTAGTWTTIVQGFTVHNVNRGKGSKWELRITDQNGVSLVPEYDEDDEKYDD